MSLLNRLRSRIDDLTAETLPALIGDENLSFSAELPAGVFGSILKLDVSVEGVAHADGERLRMRAHVQSNLASVLRPMLDAPAPAKPKKPRGKRGKRGSRESRALAPAAILGQVAGRGVRRALSNPVVRKLSDPLLRHDLNSWIEVTASTANLDGGAHDLIPKSDKLSRLGIRPARRDGAHVENWAGATPDGRAQVSTLQITKKDLPANIQKKLGDQPFNLAALVVNTAEEK